MKERTTVVHCKRDKFDVYIGRPSKWGNPFTIGKDGTRDQVIEKYREWIKTQPQLLAALHELRGKILACWCAPRACHGDVLAALADGHCGYCYNGQPSEYREGDEESKCCDDPKGNRS